LRGRFRANGSVTSLLGQNSAGDRFALSGHDTGGGPNHPSGETPM
jgi:hypothetical protein